MEAFTKFVTEEWYFAAPLFAMSLTAVMLVVWRALLNSAASTNMNQFWPQFQEQLKAGGPEGAARFCRSQPGLIPSKLLAAGLEAAPQGVAAMRRSMANAIELEILPKLHFLLAPIRALAKVATMVGLLFTVISMINTFNAIGQAQAGGQGAAQQAGAIGLALFATAFGLATAIPLVFTLEFFKDWIGRFELKMKDAGLKLINTAQAARRGPAKAAPAPQPAAAR